MSKISRVLLSLLSLFLSSHYSYASTSTPERLVISLGSEPDMGLDPILGWGRESDPLIQSTLLKRDSTLNITNNLASHYQASQDGKTWRITLKENIHFSNGEQLTAHDVAFTFELIKLKLSVYDLANLDKIAVQDERNLTFTLSQPDITFVENLISIGIVPKASYNQFYGQNPIGSGPYQLVRWDKGQQIILTRNPYYYGDQPKFETLVIVFASEDTRAALLQTNQLHLAAIPQRYSKLVQSPYKLINIASNDNRGIAWPMNAPSDTQPGNAVTADWAIRKAVEVTIDRQQLVDGVLSGYGAPAYSLVDGMPWGPTQSAATTQNLAQAKQVLTDNGWQLNANNQLEKQGLTADITLFYPAGDSIREHLSLAVASMVKPLGINITVKGASWSHIEQKMHNNPVLMGFGSHSVTELINVYAGKNGGVDWYNTGYYKNENVDKALQAAKQSLSFEQAIPQWQKVHQYLEQDLPWTWLVNIDHLYAVSECLDLGNPVQEPHQHGWPITNNIAEWRWQC